MHSQDSATTYRLVIFFYEINIFYMLTATFYSGPSLTQLKTDFSNMRKKFNARYVRLYEACDNKGF